MKSLKTYIQEKLVINSLQEKLVIKKSIIKKNKTSNYKYFPESKEELKDIILQRIEDEGNEVDLNDIDVSTITDMSNLFEYLDFNGDISNWDVSNVTNMALMFFNCEFFNQDISKWDVSSVTDMSEMFYRCFKFNKDISKWNVSNVDKNKYMFKDCPIEEKYKPKFK